MRINIPETEQKRVVIVGGGFAGLTLARALRRSDYLVVLVDKNNYHQFQPLFYQVATAGLEPSSIVYPLRKMFQRNKNIYIRVTEVKKIEPENKRLITPFGILNYDYLVLAHGADSNYFGNKNIEKHAIPMKSVGEALLLRNRLFIDFENALTTDDPEEKKAYLNIVIVGGGATGVEIAGALAEMKQHVIPKDYAELDVDKVDIHLIQGAPILLKGMSKEASEAALEFLEKLGVKVQLNSRVEDYDGEHLTLKGGAKIAAKKVIWAAGVTGNKIDGLPAEVIDRSNRIEVNEYNQVIGTDNIFAVGDIASMKSEGYKYGHPQVAQVAIQQAKTLAKNLKAISKNRPMTPFIYKDLGSMATVGRRRAVVDLSHLKLQGTFAWLIWLFVHLLQLIGFKNKTFVFINWVWNYLFYDQSLRLIIRTKRERE
ncbi:MAG TPA: NAD(P)/FAD-dependent oxidoreductase [Bacteroidetes bacterium]|nr:NAD(P)/FAD-dependent oxidoreductase [Bacteroidota bacterium]